MARTGYHRIFTFSISPARSVRSFATSFTIHAEVPRPFAVVTKHLYGRIKFVHSIHLKCFMVEMPTSLKESKAFFA